MPTNHETVSSEQKLKLFLAIVCQVVSFFVVLLLLSWGLSSI